jgi:predicted transcriptional regulator
MVSKRVLKYFKRPLHEPCKACAERAVQEATALVTVELPAYARKGPQSEIDQFGLGAEVVRLYTAGMTQQEIGNELNLTKDQVQHWLEGYRKMSIDDRKTVHKRSIFDLGDRLQEAFEMIYQELIDSKENKDLNNKNLQLLLKCIQVGGVFMEKLHAQQEDRRYKAAMLQVMEDMAPGTKAKVLRALSEMDLNSNIVRRLT